MLFNIGIFYMIVGNVILDREEEEHLKAIYKKYIDTPLEYESKFFLDKKDIEFYDRALKIDPSSYKAWFNLAHIYSIENQGKNAVSALKICQKLKPNDKETEYYLSLALMRTKKYDKGLKLFENRVCKDTAIALQNKTYPNLASYDKLWKGEKIKDKTIYVYYEGGFGDVIQFSQ